MTKEGFIEKFDLECKNTQSWSFVNHDRKEVVFIKHTCFKVIFNPDWVKVKGVSKIAIEEAKEHLRLYREEGYTFLVGLAESRIDVSKKLCVDNYIAKLFEATLNDDYTICITGLAYK